jgi:asparagine synthase (glutamine-hydrolysing)
VWRHLISDVPVGIFLSGGIDSGALAGLMIEAGAQDLEGVTIAYDEFAGHSKDEAPVAAKIAAHYGIRHTVRRVTREEFLADMPRILDAMDQPSLDGVNTWYASKAAAERGLKVVVSGVGGDELFQGYPNFKTFPRLLAVRRSLERLPGQEAALRWLGAWQAHRTGKARWRHLAQMSRDIAGLWWLSRSTEAPEALPALMGEASALSAAWRPGDEATWVHEAAGAWPDEPRLALGQIESMTYMRNQLLRDSDWASMDHSVELRTPLVDATLLSALAPMLGAFATRRPKRWLAEAPARRLPAEVTARRKSGFGIPIQTWLAGLDSRTPPPTWHREVARAYEAAFQSPGMGAS